VAATGLTFYDASYLDLALSGGEGVLVTQDWRLAQVAREKGGRAFTLDEAARAMKAGEL
jgi:predicted nucleic acid-binding protein